MNAKLESGVDDAFVAEAGEQTRRLGVQLVALESAPDDAGRLNAVFRTFHAIKGGASFLGLAPVVTLCHRAEDLLNAARSHRFALDPPAVDALLDAVDALDAMIDALAAGRPPEPLAQGLLRRLQPPVAAVPGAPPAGAAASPAGVVPAVGDDEFEALLDRLHEGKAPGFDAPKAAARAAPGPHGVRPPELSTPPPARARAALVHVEMARLDALVDGVGELAALRRRLRVLAPRDAAVAEVSTALDRVAGDLEATALALRMQPAGRLFQRFPRVVRDLARRLGKDVELALGGETVDLDRDVAEALADPLVHLLRNALDHGIGTAAERTRAGKPARGRIELTAAQRGGRVVIRVADDGRGMDPDALRRRAVEQGFVDAALAAQLSSAECFGLIFRPGFSTATVASETSGRGVGMDAVKAGVEELGGSVRVHSVRGEGTTVELELPLAMAVLRVQVVRAGAQLFALPAADVEDAFALAPEQRESVDGRLVLRRPGRLLPLANLAAWTCPDAPPGGQVVVVRSGVMRVACLVDALFPREEVIVRSLAPLLSGISGIAGAAVTADGAVALVVAPATLADAAGAILPALEMKA